MMMKKMMMMMIISPFPPGQCNTYATSPICCNATAGSTCSTASRVDDSRCDSLSKPSTCSGTSAPTQVTSR
jgi:hypothetical protein